MGGKKKTAVVASKSKHTSKTKKESASKSASGLPPNLLLNEKHRNSSLSKVEALHPGAVFVASHFFSPRECQAWIDMVESSGELEHVAHPATRYIAQRECGRWQRDDVPIAAHIFSRIQSQLLPQMQMDFPANYHAVACNSNLRIYKYEKGMSFGKHYDGSNEVPEGHTEITVLVYLSDCIGGATRFYPPRSKGRNSVAFTPQQGAILLHIHGDRCLQHEADAVQQGVKYVLRTDIVYAKS